MGELEAPFTVTVSETPHIDVGSGNVTAWLQEAGPKPVPYKVKMEPCAIPAPGKPGCRMLAAFST
jgi:hypothetical protein